MNPRRRLMLKNKARDRTNTPAEVVVAPIVTPDVIEEVVTTETTLDEVAAVAVKEAVVAKTTSIKKKRKTLKSVLTKKK